MTNNKSLVKMLMVAGGLAVTTAAPISAASAQCGACAAKAGQSCGACGACALNPGLDPYKWA